MSRGTALITGGAGFIGCNLADRLARDGWSVIVYDSLVREGAARNRDWLLAEHPGRVSHVHADLRDVTRLAEAVGRSDAVFHLAAQVAVTTSLDDPRDDFAVNLQGTLGLLEAIRATPERPPLVFASTNKVYGSLDGIALTPGDAGYAPTDPEVRRHGVGETAPLDFKSPYGCSKGGADQYVLDYAHSFGLRTVVLRMSCIYGHRQMGNEDQGWVAHFARRALAGEPVTLYGDGQQVRDILDVRDAVDAYVAALDRVETLSGRAFNLGGGPDNAVSLRTVIDALGALTTPIHVERADWRPGDQRWFVADTRAARAALGLRTPRPWQQGLADLVDWLRSGDPALAARPRGAVPDDAPSVREAAAAVAP